MVSMNFYIKTFVEVLAERRQTAKELFKRKEFFDGRLDFLIKSNRDQEKARYLELVQKKLLEIIGKDTLVVFNAEHRPQNTLRRIIFKTLRSIKIMQKMLSDFEQLLGRKEVQQSKNISYFIKLRNNFNKLTREIGIVLRRLDVIYEEQAYYVENGKFEDYSASLESERGLNKELEKLATLNSANAEIISELDKAIKSRKDYPDYFSPKLLGWTVFIGVGLTFAIQIFRHFPNMPSGDFEFEILSFLTSLLLGTSLAIGAPELVRLLKYIRSITSNLKSK